jgi:hypothetical protein
LKAKQNSKSPVVGTTEKLKMFEQMKNNLIDHKGKYNNSQKDDSNFKMHD